MVMVVGTLTNMDWIYTIMYCYFCNGMFNDGRRKKKKQRKINE